MKHIGIGLLPMRLIALRYVVSKTTNECRNLSTVADDKGRKVDFLDGDTVARLIDYCIIKAQREISHDYRYQRSCHLPGELRSGW